MREPLDEIRVDFGKSMPLFPLQHPVLLPHGMVRLFIFEPRYRQMVDDVLGYDGDGNIALACLSPSCISSALCGDVDEESPPVRPAVCVGHIAHREKLPDGCSRVVLQGVCRAKIREECPLGDEDRPYRVARLEPIEQCVCDSVLCELRERLVTKLAAEPAYRIPGAKRVLEEIDKRPELSTAIVTDLVALSIVSLVEDPALHYRLLSEGDLARRAKIVETELVRYVTTLQCAEQQFDPEAPERITWN